MKISKKRAEYLAAASQGLKSYNFVNTLEIGKQGNSLQRNVMPIHFVDSPLPGNKTTGFEFESMFIENGLTMALLFYSRGLCEQRAKIPLNGSASHINLRMSKYFIILFVCVFSGLKESDDILCESRFYCAFFHLLLCVS